jgi:hypothetical protein
MTMMFIRFVTRDRNPDFGFENGPFKLAYALRRSADVVEADRVALSDVLDWFDRHLERPSRFNRTSSKGFYRRNTRGIAWFKDTASEHLARLHTLAAILERHGHPIDVVTENRIGYVVYEDDVQVVAEPFAETRTR